MYPAIFLLLRPDRSSRLLLIFRPLLAFPHLFWGMLYGMAAGFVQFLSFWAIIFTGRHPQGLWNVLERYFRYTSRLQAWSMYLTDAYPPFSGSAEKSHPIGVRVEYPARMSRATVFFRMLVLFPHYFYFIGAAFVYMFVQFLTWWTILFLGRMTDWQFTQISAFFVYVSRIGAYALFLVDEYPPFNGVQPRAADERFA
ncbi:MAG: DUF4389 domain-containing protein [Bacteroidetes bacterium]|nr:DUF4389 domain-containing protein [Bacteroidota bacterium]